ncbi:MAG TPA: hypothetical protein PKA60_00845 [Candidatus Paceibacterota bacterium]|nr:hypothetical protein [Candidatus Paceibacterota bacterium]
MKSFTPLLLIALSVGLFFAFIDPQYSEIKTIRERININKLTIESGNQLRDKQVKISDDYKQISQERRDDLNKILPDAVDNVRLILDINNIASEINELATDGGINILNINVGGDRQASGQDSRQIVQGVGTATFGTVQLGFSIEGGYESFKEFLRQLEKSLRIVDVIDYSIGSGKIVNGRQVFSYSITINTYWLR